LASITARFGIDGLQTASFMAGVLLLLLGAVRAGDVMRYVPSTVILGFTAGIAVIIFVGQWRYFLGLPSLPSGANATHWREWVLAWNHIDPPTLSLGVLGLALAIVAPKTPGLKTIPAPLTVIVALTLLASTHSYFHEVATIGGLYGQLPRALPMPQWPNLAPARVLELLGPAVTIAMLGAIESLLSASIADGFRNTRHDPDQELLGQGLANCLVPLWGGFAATGAIARTATNARAGATGPLSGVFHSVVLLVALYSLAPYAARVPMVALATVLFVVAFNMAHLPQLQRTLLRAPVADKLIVITTLLLTVFTDIVVAVNVGVLLATLHFLRRMAHSIQVVEDSPSLGTQAEVPPEVQVFTIQGPIFFAAAREFQAVLRSVHAQPRMVLFRFENVPFVDWTGIQALEELVEEFERRRIAVGLVGLNDRVRHKLLNAHFFERFPAVRAAVDVQHAQRALESSKTQGAV
jgi:SulP family sulfate permease